jgi:hypothetical protein
MRTEALRNRGVSWTPLGDGGGVTEDDAGARRLRPGMLFIDARDGACQRSRGFQSFFFWLS